MLAQSKKTNLNWLKLMFELNGRYITTDMFRHTDNTDVLGFQAMIILLKNVIILPKHLAWTSEAIS